MSQCLESTTHLSSETHTFFGVVIEDLKAKMPKYYSRVCKWKVQETLSLIMTDKISPDQLCSILLGLTWGWKRVLSRGGSRTATTFKMELFVVIVNGFQSLVLDLGYYINPRSTSAQYKIVLVKKWMSKWSLPRKYQIIVLSEIWE